MLVALTVTPALAPAAAVEDAPIARDAPLVRVAQARLRAAADAGHPQAAPAAYAGRRAPAGRPASPRPRRSARSCTRRSRSATSCCTGSRRPARRTPEERRIIDGGSASEHARRSRACATSARTSARRSWPRRWPASNFGENWISIDRNADYDKTLQRIQDVVDALSRASTTTSRPICASASTRCSPARRSRSSSASSATDLRHARGRGRPGARTALADIPGLDDLHTELSPTCRRSR